MQNFLDIDQVDPKNLRGILDEAARIKTARTGLSNGMLDAERAFEGKMVALIFEKPSTRTRVSFDLGVR
ncbi:MAG: ornithine carbamoyltransferase, partial [Planktomarina sp.]|nr:ornithine carbamoyltransferase [Planktomarina sp.]